MPVSTQLIKALQMLQIDQLSMETIEKSMANCIKEVMEDLDADLFLFSGSIDSDSVDQFINTVREKHPKRLNVALVFTTYGGTPHPAYRLARTLKRLYEKFTLFIFGYCKSAGTLVAIGADEIVLSDFGELGPLDVQLLKDDEVIGRSSGLDLQEALGQLNLNIYDIFQDCLLRTLQSGGGAITTKTAADIASSIAIGLISPIAGQIDPLRLGEVARSVRIAKDYGMRLNNSREMTIHRLVSDYPSHSFVIDYEEAKDLFGDGVRKPKNIHEELLEQWLFNIVRNPYESGIIADLSDFIEKPGTNDGIDKSIDESTDNPSTSAIKGGQVDTNQAIKDEGDFNEQKLEKPSKLG